MSRETKITVDEFRKALENALGESPADDGGWTMREIAKGLGIGLDSAKRKVHDAVLAGSIKAYKAKRRNLWKEMGMTYVYKVVDDE